MGTTTIEIPDGLDPVDRAALELALAKARASGKTRADKARAAQIDEMLEERGWQEAAEFAAYGCQFRSLKLRPWQEPPCCVEDPDEPRVGQEEAAKLLRRMLRAKISRWHPSPLEELEKRKA
jgi:hypothetical protein